MKTLVTGGAGFLGSNIAKKSLDNGIETIILDNLSRKGSEDNLKWLRSTGDILFAEHDIRDRDAVFALIKEHKPEVIFHLAGQVAMTTSVADPILDFEVNASGSLNVLEAVRRFSPDSRVIYSSTNKVYGDLEHYTYNEEATRYVCPERPRGFDESEKLDFATPYGCSKGSADQYMLDHARMFGIKTVVFRHSSMYGGRQYPTFDQGWIGWFIKTALEAKAGKQKEPFTVSGSGKQVRDVLFCDDLVELYFTAAIKADAVKGNAFNIGGGIENSLSILELLSILEKMLDIRLDWKHIPARSSDQKFFVADNSKADRLLGWQPREYCLSGIKKTLEWLKDA